MKKTFLILFSFAAAVSLSAEEKVLAFWDFEKGFASGNYRMAKRGEAAIVDDAEQGKVFSPGKNRSKAGGIILSSHALPELQVAGPFELSMKLKYTPSEKLPQRTEFLYLWDTRYNKTGGLTLILRRSNTNKLIFSASLGNGNKVTTLLADAPANFADGKWHELKIRLDAEGKFIMEMDGKNFRTGIIPSTPLPASQRLTIGDRVGSSYGTFTGLMDDIKLTAL